MIGYDAEQLRRMADMINHLEDKMPPHCWLTGDLVWHVDDEPTGYFEVLDEGSDDVSWLYVPYSDKEKKQWHVDNEARIAKLSGDLTSLIAKEMNDAM